MQLQTRYRPGDIIGGYYIHQVLIGGMGEVYLCFSSKWRMPVALKTFQARYFTNPKLRDAFKREVATWVALESHPNIVRCFEMEMINNQPFMVLEWVAGDENWGTDLRSWLRWGTRDLRTILDLAIDICRGLIHAGQKQPGLVHRDLKPENILLAQGPVAKITDFGLAKIVQEAELAFQQLGEPSGFNTSLLGASGLVGTPLYMAPEQWLGEPVDVRTDIYAVGCILLEMLNGHIPFAATTLEGLRQQHLSAPAPRVTENVPDGLANLVAKCLNKQRQGRFKNIEELTEALTEVYQIQFAVAPHTLTINTSFTAQDYNNRGYTYIRLERYEDALSDFTHAIDLDSGNAIHFLSRSIAHYRLGHHEEAFADSNRAIELDPNNASAYVTRGNTYGYLNRFEEALENYSYALQHKLGTQTPLTYANRGSAYYELGRHSEALADLTHAIELDPSLAKAYSMRGTVFSELHRENEALADFTRAIELDPGHPDFFVDRARLYEKLQRYDEALKDCAYALQFDAKGAKSYARRGQIYYSMERYEEALADFSRALQLEPSDADTYCNRGSTYQYLRRYEEALADFSRALQLDPSNAVFYFNRGNMYKFFLHYEDAIADFTQALHFNPKMIEAYLTLGSSYNSLGRDEEALSTYARALELEPDNAHVYYQRGNVYNKRLEYERAVSDYSAALKLDRNMFQAYTNLGGVLAALGRYREALPYLERAAQLGDFVAVQQLQLIKESTQIDDIPFEVNPLESAVEALLQANSVDDIERAIVQFPFMTDLRFIAVVERFLEQVPQALKAALEQRIAYLKRRNNN
jgi:tetratricopeptide (TPR) repeat protein